jgi:hypothetical protein
MLISIARFGLCENEEADSALVRWGHWLGGCNRPFGRISYGLWWEDELVSVAVSASTVNARCGGYDRQACVELARLCSAPDHRDLTRVMLRLWRKSSATDWARFWPVQAYVSYSNALRHKGDIYRFDGWRKVADVPGGSATGGWTRAKSFDPKSVWVYPLVPADVH